MHEPDCRIEYTGHGRYAIYIKGEFFKEYDSFEEAADEYDARLGVA